MMQVPFVDLKAQYQEIKTEIDAGLAEVMANTAFIGGKYATAFEEDFAAYCGTRHCVGVGNGTDALQAALFGLGIGAGDEVITAANTFIATAEAVHSVGADVVFVDNDPVTYNIDIDRIEAAITPRTKAIIPVHLYGQPADLDAILAIAAKHGLKVIEDAAQAHGATYKGRRVSTFGDCACFSFYPGKNLGAYGDAGAVVTDDGDLAERIRMFTNHGRSSKHGHEIEGINSRLDGFQGLVLRVKLPQLERWTERRIAIAERYSEGLTSAVTTPVAGDQSRHVYHLYVVRVEGRGGIQAKLAERGISTGIHYPVALPFLPAYARLQAQPADFPIAHAYQNTILSLPMHGSMPDEQVDYVIEQLNEIVE